MQSDKVAALGSNVKLQRLDCSSTVREPRRMVVARLVTSCFSPCKQTHVELQYTGCNCNHNLSVPELELHLIILQEKKQRNTSVKGVFVSVFKAIAQVPAV